MMVHVSYYACEIKYTCNPSSFAFTYYTYLCQSGNRGKEKRQKMVLQDVTNVLVHGQSSEFCSSEGKINITIFNTFKIIFISLIALRRWTCGCTYV